MQISRRNFLKYCSASAAALRLGAFELIRLEKALAAESVFKVLWLHGSGCQGDSISLLNLYADIDPVGSLTIDEVLLHHIELAYHTVLMSSAGSTAVQMAQNARTQGGYVLVLEGGVPTAFNGHACLVYSEGKRTITYQRAVAEWIENATAVMCVGTCACFGGIVASGPDPFEHNPTDVISAATYVQQLDSSKFVMNIPGCPAHPAWTTWGLVQLLLDRRPDLDSDLRPVSLFGNKQQDPETLNIHTNCPRNPNRHGPAELAEQLGEDHKCLENLGCRGPNTYADCPSREWHNGENGPVNWCVDCNGLCLGCVESDFPGGPFYT